MAVNKDLTAVELTLTSLLVARQTYNNLTTSLGAQATPSLEHPLVSDTPVYPDDTTSPFLRNNTL